MTIPASQLPGLVSLTADGYMDFIQIDLRSGSSIYIKEGQDSTWNGETWTGTTVQLSGVAVYGDDQVSRPKLQAINPDAIFSPFVADGVFDKAQVTRYRVLVPDVIANNLYFIKQVWLVNRVAQCNRVQISLELRTIMDAPNFTIPPNTYSPPVYPTVTIS